jgi:glucokinase
MTEIVAVDIGGTHARFAIAGIEGGRVTGLNHGAVLKAAEHASLQTAWEAYAEHVGRPLPRAAGIAVACPVDGGPVLKLTNNPWIIRPALIPEKLGVDRFTLVNDFGAVGHAVAQLGAGDFRHLYGPEEPLPEDGVISIVGPGTGLGVAMLSRSPDGNRVIETEGGHIDFAPLDTLEDQILIRLRAQFRRVSVERVVAGPGLASLHAALAAIEGRAAPPMTDAALWALALSGEDSLASAAFDRFCRCLGAVAGDIALAQGAKAVVIAGGLGLRIAGRLPASGFEDRFRAKGRFEGRMAAMPVKLVTYAEPGLFGAAVAFGHAHP